MKLLNWLRSDAFLRKQLGEARRANDALVSFMDAKDVEINEQEEEIEMLKEKLSKKRRPENHPSI